VKNNELAEEGNGKFEIRNQESEGFEARAYWWNPENVRFRRTKHFGFDRFILERDGRSVSLRFTLISNFWWCPDFDLRRNEGLRDCEKIEIA
jgi:hypothetical protein